jgi:hypothetical protein
MQGVPRVLSKVPVRATGAIDRMARGLASGPVGRALVRRQFRRLAGVSRPERVLVIADVNIGDAMLIQPAVAALDGLLPDATIDFAVNATVGPLVADDPRVGTTFAVLRGDADAPAVTAQRLREALDHADYGLVVNACPFIGDRDAASFGGAVVSPLSLAVGILDAYAGGRPAAVPIQVSALVHRALDAMPGVDVPEHPTTESSRVYLRAQVRRDAVALLRELDIDPTRPTVFVNPDTSNDSTFLGEDVLVEVVARMTALPSAGGVLLGRGFTYRGVEDRILEALDGEQRRAVRLVPRNFRWMPSVAWSTAATWSSAATPAPCTWRWPRSGAPRRPRVRQSHRRRQRLQSDGPADLRLRPATGVRRRRAAGCPGSHRGATGLQEPGVFGPAAHRVVSGRSLPGDARRGGHRTGCDGCVIFCGWAPRCLLRAPAGRRNRAPLKPAGCARFWPSA